MWLSRTPGCGISHSISESISFEAIDRQQNNIYPKSPTSDSYSGFLTWVYLHLIMSTTTAATDLVSKLPLRLRNFFARYPPQIYSAAVRPPVTEPETPAPAAEESLPSPYTPNRDAKGFKKPDPKAFSPSKSLLYSNPEHPNPFLPRKNFRNGKWIGPPIGLRRQAELVKLAIKYNVEALLPPGRKSTEYKETRRAERGLAIKGTGVGQKVKGHKWERTMEARLEDRRKAMMEMPEMIRLWKQVSIQLMLSLWLEGVEANLMRCTERSWSWLEAMAQEVNESMSISLLSHGISSCRIFFICQSSTQSLAEITVWIIDGVWDGSSCLHMYCTNRCSSKNRTKHSMFHRIWVYTEHFKINKFQDQKGSLTTGLCKDIIRRNKFKRLSGHIYIYICHRNKTLGSNADQIRQPGASHKS